MPEKGDGIPSGGMGCRHAQNPEMGGVIGMLRCQNRCSAATEPTGRNAPSPNAPGRADPIYLSTGDTYYRR